MIRTIKSYVKWLMRPYYIATANRSTGLDDELKFWDKWLRTKGFHWPEDYKRRLDPDAPLSEYHRRFIDHLPQEQIRILDVGAGPLTGLGKRHPSKQLIVVATDVLAEKYDLLLKKYAIQPPVRTVFAEAERLTEIYDQNTFDFVSAENSIDHTYDPLEATRQMLSVVKENCFVGLNHFENEADNQHYKGLHQWNISVQDGLFLIKGRSRAINVSHELASLGEFECLASNNWVTVHVKKRPVCGC